MTSPGFEQAKPGYTVSTEFKGYISFYAPEAYHQRKINKFVFRVQSEVGDDYVFDFTCGGIKMTFDWFGVEGPDRKVVERITKKVYNYLKRFKQVRINP